VDTTVKVQLLWRGIWHDKDKFYPDEWFPYARFFYNPDGSKVEKIRDSTGYYKAAETGNKPFDFAWLLHQKRNDHHWQWWVLPLDDGGIKTLDMSSIARIEMVCDWRGAGSAQGFPKTWEWYAKNRNNMQLHPETRTWIEDQLYKQALTQDGIEAANIFYSTIHEGA
jgi:hypothetical protein